MITNKSKIKRVLKELDGHKARGRYVEWLTLAAETGLYGPNDLETKEVCGRLLQTAYASSSSLREFIGISDRIHLWSSDNDVKAFFALKEFIRHGTKSESIHGILSSSTLSRRFINGVLSWTEDSSTTKRLSNLLSVFATKPTTVTLKHYNELSSILKDPTLAEPINQLGTYIKTIEKTFKKTKGLELENLQDDLEEAESIIPEGLYKVVTYPLAFKIASKVSDFLKNGSLAEIEFIMYKAPKALSFLSVEHQTLIRERLQEAGMGGFDVRDMKKKLTTATLDEKISLLGQLKQCRVQDRFYDSYELSFYLLLSAILMDIKSQRVRISEVELRELPKVVGPIVRETLMYLLDSPEYVVDLLIQSSEAGCMDTKLALLALVVSSLVSEGPLRKLTEREIKRLDLIPTTGDLQWVFDTTYSIVGLDIGHYKPLVEVYDDEGLVRNIGRQILQNAILILLAQKALPSFMEAFFGSNQQLIADDIEDFKEGLMELSVLPSMAYLRTVAKSKHEDVYPILTALLGAYRADNHIDDLLELFIGVTGHLETTREAGRFLSPKPVKGTVVKAFSEVMKGQWSDLNNASEEVIERFVKRVSSDTGMDDLLIPLFNALTERYQKGIDKERKWLAIVEEAVFKMKKGGKWRWR